MKLRDDLENKILKSVIKELHRLVMYSIDNGQNSGPALDGDMWIDVYDKVDDTIYSVNISWEYYEDYDETTFNVVVYPTEEYENEQGEVRIREIMDGDCVVLMD